MKFALIFTALTAWALWLGGTIATFVFGKHYFAVFPREMAGQSANAMFHVFRTYQLGLAGVLIFATAMLLVSYPSKGYVLALGVVLLASVMMIAVCLGFMPRMDSMIEDGQQQSHEFLTLHIKSMIAMTIQAGLLLISGVILLVSAGVPVKMPTNRQASPGFEPMMAQ